ncbi:MULTISPECIES: hypothetical protein [unclassified Streptomyces]|uniref:deoxynucleotide monophosphate kinase family protein n=1 Tax=unclassified Streptomyces TaxID=2593676 RepID=UPI0036E854D0
MNIGIIGRARVGKDTAGQWLVDNRGYRRVAFADPLKEAALGLDPIIEQRRDIDEDGEEVAYNVGLRWLVDDHGWEAAKDTFPEVRRILQELGASIRAIDPEFWLRAALTKVTAANEGGVPCVITDVRYPNEAESLKRAGFRLVHINRPGVPRLDHESERSLGWADAHVTVNNHRDLPHLYKQLEEVWEDVHAEQSRRFAMKF